MAVQYSIDGVVALLAINNPPVNAISVDVRRGIKEGLEKAEKDSSVKVILIHGTGRCFLSGADIREFGNRYSFAMAPILTEVVTSLDSCPKPIVAAIHSFCLGGGLEVALGSHYRIASDDAVFGFPEVDLGILPAACGTQLFPRVVGLKHALDLIPSGRRIKTSEALRMGLVDKVIKGDRLAEGLQFAKSVVGKPFRRSSQLPIKESDRLLELRTEALTRVKLRTPGVMSPIFAVHSTCGAVNSEFEAGCRKEQELAFVLFGSGQARALQYSFFAQRTASKWTLPDGRRYGKVTPMPVKRVGVVGLGTMGSGIAIAALNAGYNVSVMEQTKEFLNKGVAMIKTLLAESVKLGKATEAQVKERLSRMRPIMSYAELKDVDLVIEAVFEKLDLKKQVFSELDRHCSPHAILCSNTSALDIEQIASATKRPEKVIGTHFFVPAYYMKLLENVYHPKTSQQTIETVMDFGQRLGKVSVLCGNCFGFIGNRMMYNRGHEAVFMLEEGAWPEQIDQVIKTFGFPIGVFEVGDLSGLDIAWLQRKQRFADANREMTDDITMFQGEKYSPLVDILCRQNRLGRKTGQGWYRYERPNAKVAYPDPEIKTILEKFSAARGIKRRQFSAQEIEERCLLPLMNEGFKILEEGIASRPEEIDTIVLLGFGWPRQTGGPMFYANQIGLRHLYERLRYYQQKLPFSSYWQPSDLLRRLAEQEKAVPMNKWVNYIAGRSTSRL